MGAEIAARRDGMLWVVAMVLALLWSLKYVMGISIDQVQRKKINPPKPVQKRRDE